MKPCTGLVPFAATVLFCAAALAARPPVEAPRPGTAAAARAEFAGWAGTYASPAEIGGFSGTVLSLKVEQFVGPVRLAYRMTFYSDVRINDMIDEPVKHGDALVDGDVLYHPTAHGWRDKAGKVSLDAAIEKYVRVRINGKVVLLRPDALRAYREESRLYDYGLLIRVGDPAKLDSDLDKTRHPSIKTLFADSSKPWADPFVHGPNAR